LYHPALILPLKVLGAVETACLMNSHDASARELSSGNNTTLRIARLISGKLEKNKVHFVILS
jgi:ABC-type transport system involved in cytochrome c biogenesis ATPase subunit